MDGTNNQGPCISLTQVGVAIGHAACIHDSGTLPVKSLVGSGPPRRAAPCEGVPRSKMHPRCTVDSEPRTAMNDEGMEGA